MKISKPTNKYGYAEFEILTTVGMNSAIFRVITPCSPVKINFYKLCSLLGLLFHPEGGGTTFIENFG
jgi:hypothetical protein